jgi:NitT/TauT family transport system substrate-binding protein
MQISFSRRSMLAAVALGVAAPVTARAQTRLEKGRISLAVADRGAISSLPLLMAEQLGYFRAEGLVVDLVDATQPLRGSAGAVFSLADVVCGSQEQLVTLLAQGVACQSFVLPARAPGMALGVPFRAAQGHRKVADLKGRRIGILAQGSLSHLTAVQLLWRSGLTSQMVSFVTLGSAPAAVAAFRAGQIEALCHSDPAITMLEQGGDIRLLADARSLKGSEEVFGGPMPAAALYAPTSFIQKNPQTVQALTNAVVRSLKWLQTAGPSDLIRTVPESYLLGDRALYLGAFNRGREGLSPDGQIPDEAMRTAVLAMSHMDAGIKPQSLDLAGSYTNEFVRQAKLRYKA